MAACSDVPSMGTKVTRATVTSASPEGAIDPVQGSISRVAELVPIALVDGGLRHRVVASQLDEGDPIRAFSVGGEPVRLAEEAAPRRPILAPVPVTTNIAAPIDTSEFMSRDRANGRAIGVYGRMSVSANHCVLECGGGSGGTKDPDGPLLDPRWEDRSARVWLVRRYLKKRGESWTKGDPELEIHTARNDPTDEVGDGNIIRCVSESRAGEGSYLQNAIAMTGM